MYRDCTHEALAQIAITLYRDPEKRRDLIMEPLTELHDMLALGIRLATVAPEWAAAALAEYDAGLAALAQDCHDRHEPGFVHRNSDSETALARDIAAQVKVGDHARAE